ncbi:MAG: PBP1A family penicillin-binding protein [Deltaproteobacteria bacterium]|nr:PBP1A family penicillin-binding protein [Deltaproteobacteria bacterium]
MTDDNDEIDGTAPTLEQAATVEDPGSATRSSGGMGQKPRVPVGPQRPPETRASQMPSEQKPWSMGDYALSNAASEPSRPPPEESKRAAMSRKSVHTKREESSARTWVIRSVLAVISLGFLGLAGVVGLFVYYGRDLPDVHNLRAHWRPPQTTRVLARDGTVLAELFIERRTVIPIEQVPINLVRAVLAAEDADFYRHTGLDYPGMLRALWINVRKGTTAQGASTITQQVVKNVFLTPERSLARKVREVVLARRIEAELGKNEILYLYLNHIAFGHGRNGVEEAARFYFGKHARELTLGECVLLAGIPKSPVQYSPRNHPEAARRRRRWILNQMVDKEFISRAEADAADAEPMRIREGDDDEGNAPEVVEQARSYLRQIAGDTALRDGGYTVYTSIDPVLQRAAREAVQVGLRELDDRQGYRGPLLAPGVRRARGGSGNVQPAEAAPADGRLIPGRIYRGTVESVRDADPGTHTPGEITVRVGPSSGVIPWNSVARYVRSEPTPTAFAPIGSALRVSVDRTITPESPGPMRIEMGPQAALVAIDPVTREVRALVGSYEGVAGGFDRASRAMRQPGSAFKPFLYSLALSSRRMNLASMVDPNPRCFGTWCPSESHHRPNAPAEPLMSLREALAQSRNIVAAQVVTDLTAPSLVAHARSFGLSAPMDPVPALALGVASLSPLEMTNAYAVWASGGRYEAPRMITRIVGPDGRDIPLPTREAPRVVISPAESFLVTSMMTSVVQRGTAQRAQSLGRPVAGKTGTTNGSRDAWFVGYTPDLVAGVWVGFDDRQRLGSGEEGARSALPMWVRFFGDYVRARRPAAVDFVRPEGIVTARIDPVTGMLARPGQSDAIDEYFLSGTEPREVGVPQSDAGPSALSSFFTMGEGGIPLEALSDDDDDAGAPERDASIPSAAAAPSLPNEAPSETADSGAP